MGMAGALAWSTRPARKITRKELRGRRCALSRLPEIRETKKGLIIWKAQGRPQMLQRHGDKCHGEVGLRRRPSVEGLFPVFLLGRQEEQFRAGLKFNMQVTEEERVQQSRGESRGKGRHRCALVCTEADVCFSGTEMGKNSKREERDPALRSDLEQTEPVCDVPLMCGRKGL